MFFSKQQYRTYSVVLHVLGKIDQGACRRTKSLEAPFLNTEAEGWEWRLESDGPSFDASLPLELVVGPLKRILERERDIVVRRIWDIDAWRILSVKVNCLSEVNRHPKAKLKKRGRLKRELRWGSFALETCGEHNLNCMWLRYLTKGCRPWKHRVMS